MYDFFQRGHTRLVPIRPESIYWSFAAWTVGLGLFLVVAPDDWYGPTWSYSDILPHNGFYMGWTCLSLGVSQLWALWKGYSAKVLSILFFLSGFVFWTAGISLAAEGLAGHTGLMEAPFMLYVGAHKFAHSAALMALARIPQQLVDEGFDVEDVEEG